MIKVLFIPVITLLLLMSGCTKDPLTQPAKVFFDFELIALDEENLKNGPPVDIPAGKLSVSQGTLAIESIEFDGRRDQGKDVFFVSDLARPLLIDLESGNSNQNISFDIPQGVYNRVEFDLMLGGDGEIPLVLTGSIKRGNISEIPLRFEYNIREQLRIKAKSAKQEEKIVLRKDTPSTARIVVDARSIFQLVNMSVLQNANVSILGGEETILINLENNGEIFNSMANRIEKSFSIIFN
ncbi:MAG: hypothetical protein ACOCU3_01570 [bacterium]